MVVFTVWRLALLNVFEYRIKRSRNVSMIRFPVSVNDTFSDIHR